MTRSRVVAGVAAGLLILCCAFGAGGAFAMHKDNPTQVPVGKENPTQIPVSSSEESAESAPTAAAEKGDATATSQSTETPNTATSDTQTEANPATAVEREANFTG